MLARQTDGLGQHVTSTLYDAAFEIIGHEFQNASLSDQAAVSREELGQALTGIQTSWANDTGEPQMFLYPLSDVCTGHLAAFGVLLSLLHRNRTGEAQTVSASLAQTATLLQAPDMIDFHGRTWDLPSGQHVRGYTASDQLYDGADGRWFSMVADRLPADVVVANFSGLSAAEAVARLNAAGHSAHVVARAGEIANDPIALDRGISLGDNVGVVRRLTRTPMPVMQPTAQPGSDAQQVLIDLQLGHLWDELTSDGVVVNLAAPD